MSNTAMAAVAHAACLSVEWVGDVCIARLRGSSLDEAWIKRLESELIALIERNGCRKLVVSLGKVDCLYSLLLGKLIVVRRSMLQHGGRLKLCDVTPLAREVFRVCKLNELFEFAADRGSAVEDW